MGRQVEKTVIGWSGNLRAETKVFVVDLEGTVVDCSVQAPSQVDRVGKNKAGSGEWRARSPAAATPFKEPLSLLIIACLTQGFLNMAYGRACCVHLLPVVI